MVVGELDLVEPHAASTKATMGTMTILRTDKVCDGTSATCGRAE